MKEYRYTLEAYKGMKTRFKCPNCNKHSVFTKYVDLYTGEYLGDTVGYCSRLVKCGYHYKPKHYFTDNSILLPKIKTGSCVKPIPQPKLKTDFIRAEVMSKTINTNGCKNNFIEFLSNVWDVETAQDLAKKYNIGTSKLWNGATVFWQVDVSNKVRSGKIMLYDSSNGKRVKKPYSHINWVHKALKLESFNLQQCYFGEHLLKQDASKPVAIVESEKTAIISSVFLPEFIWLACGSLNNLNEAKTKVLKGRSVVLFPDLSCFDLWNNKIKTLTKLAVFRTSTLLRNNATDSEKKQGLDLADYLLKIQSSLTI